MIKKIKGFLKKYNIDDVDKIFWFSIVFMLLAMICVMNGCVSSIYKVRKENINDQVKITHVLAITEMGDTLKIPISEIKPKVIYNVVGYDYMRYNPYYSPYNNRYYYNLNPQYIYNPYSDSGGGSHSGTPTSWQPIPITPNNGSSGNYSGTSGFSGNPVASNPVTSNGGAKTKN